MGPARRKRSARRSLLSGPKRNDFLLRENDRRYKAFLQEYKKIPIRQRREYQLQRAGEFPLPCRFLFTAPVLGGIILILAAGQVCASCL